MSENPTVLLETTSGDILIELFPDKAPETVANFLQYVDAFTTIPFSTASSPAS